MDLLRVTIEGDKLHLFYTPCTLSVRMVIVPNRKNRTLFLWNSKLDRVWRVHKGSDEAWLLGVLKIGSVASLGYGDLRFRV